MPRPKSPAVQLSKAERLQLAAEKAANFRASANAARYIPEATTLARHERAEKRKPSYVLEKKLNDTMDLFNANREKAASKEASEGMNNRKVGDPDVRFELLEVFHCLDADKDDKVWPGDILAAARVLGYEEVTKEAVEDVIWSTGQAMQTL